ncbi:hypothetical protein E0E50_15255 [Azotobacter chroococcum subsp. isscasi]|uniref:hypothetical protein n=1 Tax=Azotobacter chroococcum TaxID=353 RepID=UPI00103EFAFA|nr:hypothetical protein [Azotobacter chroococcum]TBW08315.1 hypothetical protein E0E50_15255 [Azotobacter chroococcum subsp. isscasi]
MFSVWIERNGDPFDDAENTPDSDQFETLEEAQACAKKWLVAMHEQGAINATASITDPDDFIGEVWSYRLVDGELSYFNEY